MKATMGKIAFGITDLGQNVFLNLVGFYFLFFMTGGSLSIMIFGPC